MKVRIFKPAKTAMQSGTGNTHEWVLEPEPSPKQIDPLMGWTSSRDMTQEIKLNFETKEEAVSYAERNGIAYSIEEPTARKTVRKAYADNFKFGRIGAWTH